MIRPRFKIFIRKYSSAAAANSDVLPFDKIPGPRGFLGLGNLLSYSKMFGKYSFDEMHKSGMDKYLIYGPIVCERMLPGVHTLWLYDPNDIAQAWKDIPGDYPRRRSHLALAKYRKNKPEVYKTAGLIPTNGEEWWRLRSEFQKGLSKPQNVRNFLPEADGIVKEFLKNLPSQFNSENVIEEMLDELSRLSLELIFLMTFDSRINAFSEAERHPDSVSSKLMKASDETTRSTMYTDHGFPLWELFETPHYKKIKESQEFIEKIAIDLVGKKLKQAGEGNSLLDQYFKNPNVDIKDIYGMSADLLFAGVHTSSFALSYALYHISKHPRIQEIMHEEATKVLPNESDTVTPAVMNVEIPYTRAVLKETFRINPISIGFARVTNRDMVIGGYHIPKNTTVVTQNLVSCRLEKYFPDPMKFIPERWINSEGQRRVDINPHLVLPFGHGMRACVARRFAEQNILLTLLRMMRIYKLEWKGCSEPLDFKTKLINEPCSKISLKFIRR